MIEPILGAFMLGTVPIRNEIVPTTKPVAPIVEIHIPIEKPKLYEIKPIEANNSWNVPFLSAIIMLCILFVIRKIAKKQFTKLKTKIALARSTLEPTRSAMNTIVRVLGKGKIKLATSAKMVIKTSKTLVVGGLRNTASLCKHYLDENSLRVKVYTTKTAIAWTTRRKTLSYGLGQLGMVSVLVMLPAHTVAESTNKLQTPGFSPLQEQASYVNVATIKAPQLEELPKLEPIPIPKPKAPQRAVNRAPAGWYPKGQCTWYIWTKRDVPGWNNASEWKWQAKRDGWTVSNTPVVGAIAWEPGHVAYVEKVSKTTVTVSEMNVKGLGVVSYRTVPYREFSYLY